MKDNKLEFLKRMREEMKKVYAGKQSVENVKEMIRQENEGGEEKITENQKKVLNHIKGFMEL